MTCRHGLIRDPYKCVWIYLATFVALSWVGSSATAQFLYWAEASNSVIRRGDVNGTGSPTTLFDSGDGVGGPYGIAVDFAASKIYWAMGGYNEFNGLQAIQVGNLDGSGSPTTLFDSGDGLDKPTDIELDIASGKIYFTDSGFAGAVVVANMDGSGSPTTLFDDTVGSTCKIGLAINPASGKLYWADVCDGVIYVGNMDGSGTPSILFDSSDGVDTPNGVELDVPAGKIYVSGPDIKVGNLDGTGSLTQLTDNINFSNAMTLDTTNAKIYWTDVANDQIGRSELSGSPFMEQLFTSLDGLDDPRDIVVDPPDTPSGPANNECGSAITIGAGDSVNGSTDGATGSDLGACTFNDTLDVWYTYTAASSGKVRIDTNGSMFDTTLVILSSCGGLELQCDDDGGTGTQSLIDLDVTSGTTYLIRIAGYDGASGDFSLNLSSVLPPGPTDIVWVDFAYQGLGNGAIGTPFNTLAGALGTVDPDGLIEIKGDTNVSGSSETLTINQSVTINAVNGAVRIGDFSFFGLLGEKLKGTSERKTGFVSRGSKGQP